MMTKKRIGEYLKNLRISKKREDGKSYTQLDLVKEFFYYGVVISVNAIDEWENGVSLPNPENLEILSDFFNKTIDEILDAEDRKNINYEDIYFLANNDWKSKKDIDNLYLIRNEQIKLITSRFKELIHIRIDRDFTYNEEEEFRFLFTNFYLLSDFAKKYLQSEVNDDYLLFKMAIRELLIETRNMEKEEKYWELQKLYTESEELWFSFWRDVCDLSQVSILQERYYLLENWQKDALLAMFQNIEPYAPNPEKYGSKLLKRYEDNNGEYDINKIRRNEIRELINHGACLNKCFYNIKEGYTEEKRIIDRLEELYNLCLKPIKINMPCDDGTVKEYLIENNQKNRFINNYYFQLQNQLNGYQNSDSKNSNIEDIYNWFINNDEISDDIYLKVANANNIDINKEKKYWMSDVKAFTLIDKYFYEYKKIEKNIADGLEEIKILKSKLESGEYLYKTRKYRIIGGSDEKSIRSYINRWRSGITYLEFLKGRDAEMTKKLLEEIDKMSFTEIRDKYYKIEEIENE